MEAAQVNPAGIAKPHTHPLLLVAASSITMLSLAAVATLAGWLPGPGARAVDPLASVAAAAAAAPPRRRSRSSRPSRFRRKSQNRP
ncbi:MAG: hypothetical protein IPI44_02645 [Sulfuritalea sp.]|nr:hypothetical protein [Sulfuritalea sp.]